MGTWKFEELRGGPRRTPQEAELFKDDESGSEDYAGNDHLVREVLQNSLDAKLDPANGPVKVRLALHDEIDAPEASRLAYYFSRLQLALKGRDFSFTNGGVPDEQCRFLVCEDFGTRGLEGDPVLFSDPNEGDTARQDFYWFWRNIGRSGKTGDDLGRWGLGKTVFRAVSRVGSMFGLTIRESDGSSLMMGQVVLQPHCHEGNEYHPEGYWCSDASGDLPAPIESKDELEQFRKEWRLTRDGEPGTSIVAPFVPEELDEQRLLRAVIVHFFTRILRGELVVEVCGPSVGNVEITSETITDVAKQITWNGTVRMKQNAPPPLVFAERCLSVKDFTETATIGESGAPKLDDSSFEKNVLESLRNTFADNELVSLKIRIALPRRSGETLVGEMLVHVQRKEDGKRADSYYVREGMTITKPNSSAGKRGVQALVIVDPGPMAELLGDTEGPAHEDWSKSADRPNKEWKKWSGRVGFARRIVDNVVEYLTPPTDGPDRDLLADFFSVELQDGGQKKRQLGERKKEKGKFPPVQAKPRWFQITQRSGGFTVSRNQNVPLPKKAMLRVAIAYDVPRGNPLRNWSPLDFRIANKPPGLKPTGSGVKPNLEQGNQVVLTILDDSFSFAVDGFDLHRDLYVRVDEITPTDTDNEATNHD